jgi:hypothetical protein
MISRPAAPFVTPPSVALQHDYLDRHPTKDEGRRRPANFVAELSAGRHFKIALSPIEDHLGRCGF